MRACLLWLASAALAVAGWAPALPGWKYEFPRDHGNHPDFKTEWWYFTGNLEAADGREFGYQLTFFRQGVRPPGDGLVPQSRFVTSHIKFAHFTVSDLRNKKFHFFQKLSRGAYDEAGFADGDRLAWIDDWQMKLKPGGGFLISAKTDGVSINLDLAEAKAPVIHGKDGVSQKSTGEGRGSHYYSLPSLTTTGTVNGFPVTGKSWFDHEWASNQLGEDQVGWDWISLHLDDGSELMLFQLRKKDGTRDEHSSGTLVGADGTATPIGIGDFTLDPVEFWTSPETGGKYPIAWRITIPGRALELDLRAAMPDQELRLKPIVYWEGVVRVSGKSRGAPVSGKGYLEMTGYAGKIVGMQSGQ